MHNFLVPLMLPQKTRCLQKIPNRLCTEDVQTPSSEIVRVRPTKSSRPVLVLRDIAESDHELLNFVVASIAFEAKSNRITLASPVTISRSPYVGG